MDDNLGDLTYTIRVNDTSGNFIQQGIQTIGVTDDDNPGLDSDDSANSGTTGDNFVFDITVSDNVAVDSVNVTWAHGGLGGNVALNDDGDGTWSLTIVLDDNLGDLTYSIRVNDTSGNFFQQAVQTIGVTDNDNPAIDSDDSLNSGTTGDNFVFDVTVSDNIAVDSVNVTWAHGGLGGNDAMNDDGDGTWSLTIVLDDNLGDLTYSIRVNDTSGNFIQQAVQTIGISDDDNPVLDSDDSPNSGTSGDNFVFDISLSDNIGIDMVYANWSHGALSGNDSMTDDGDGTWSLTIVLDNSLVDLTYYIWFNDTSDNIVKGAMQTATMGDNDPPTLDSDDSPNAGTTGDNFVFNVSVSDNIDVDMVYVNWTHGGLLGNDSMNDDGDGTWSLTIVLDDSLGDLTYYLWFNDTSNNIVKGGLQTVGVTDNDAPTLDSDDSPNAGTTGDNFVFNVSLSDNIGIDMVYINWTHGGLFDNDTMTDDGDGTWSLTIVLDDSIGDLTYYIWFNDTSNNIVKGALQTIGIVDDDNPMLDSDDSPDAGTTGDNFVFNVSVSDNVAVDSVNVTWAHGGLGGNAALNDDGDGTWSLTIALDHNLGYLTYSLQVNDTSGNFIRQAEQMVAVTDNDAPTFDADDTNETGTTGDDFWFTINASDNIGVDTVYVNWTHAGSSGNLSLTLVGDSWIGMITLNHSIQQLAYTIYINDTSNIYTMAGEFYRNVTDNDAPTFIADWSELEGTTGDNFEIVISAIDNIDGGIHSVYVNWTHGGINHNESLIYNPIDENWSFTISLGDSVGDLVYTISINDSANLWISVGPTNVLVIDNDDPSLVADNTAGIPTTGDSFVFDVEVGDNIAIAEVWFNYTFDNDWDNPHRQMTLDIEMNFTLTLNIEADATIVYYKFHILDAAGNWFNSTEFNIAILDNDEPVFVSDNTNLSTFKAGGWVIINITISDNTNTRGLDTVQVNYTMDGMVNATMALAKLMGTDFWIANITILDSATFFTYHIYAVDDEGNVLDTYNPNEDPMEVPDTTNPVADAGGDRVVDQHENVTFNGSQSGDNVGILTYTWSFTYNGSLVTLYGMEATFKFDIAGTYLVWLNVSDGAFNWHTDNLTVTVQDITEPTADAGLAIYANEDTMVIFNASGSMDNLGIINYTWTINGMYFYGEVVNYTFETPGEFNVTLNISDAAGNTAETYVLVTIKDITDPIVTITGGNQTVDEDEPVAFAVTADDNVGIVNYTWLVDSSTFYGATLDYTFDTAGVFTVKVTVEDAAGNTATSEVTITVEAVTIVDNEEPVITKPQFGDKDIPSGGTLKIDEGETIALDAGNITDNLDNDLDVVWTIVDPDGNSVNLVGSAKNYKFEKAGRYTVTLTVTDDANNSATHNFKVDVEKAGADPDDDDGFPIWIIIVIVLIILIIIVVIIFLRRGKEEEEEEMDELEEELEDEDGLLEEEGISEIDEEMEIGELADEEVEEIVEFRCPECDALVAETDEVCLGCGAEFEEEIEEEIEVIQYECPECGSMVDETALACSGCGVEFEGEEEIEEVVEDAEEEGEVEDLEDLEGGGEEEEELEDISDFEVDELEGLLGEDEEAEEAEVEEEAEETEAEEVEVEEEAEEAEVEEEAEEAKVEDEAEEAEVAEDAEDAEEEKAGDDFFEDDDFDDLLNELEDEL